MPEATTAVTTCPTDVVQDFINLMGIPVTGTGKYEVRQQVVKDNALYVTVNSYDEQDAADSQYAREDINGSKVTFAILIAPNGQLSQSKGCPLKKADVEPTSITKRKWFWPVVIALILAAGIGATVYFVRRRKLAQEQ